MKHIFLVIFSLSSGMIAAAQELLPDQNPNFAASRNKYIAIADSINVNQSTTQQQTYKAIDYLVDKAEAKAARKEDRRQYRAARRYNGYSYYGYPSTYYPSYGLYPSIGYQFGGSYYHHNRNHRNGYNYGNYHRFNGLGIGTQLMFGSPFNYIW